MKVLSDTNNAGIITWMPSGQSFNILNPKAFVADILPTEFKTAKYSSFTRKLHRWGFMRHYRGEEAGAFYHKDFQRGRLDLVEQMTCHKPEPPKSTPVITTTVAQKKALVKPAPLRAPAVLKKPLPGTTRALLPAPPVTPKTIKMSILKMPTSALTTSSLRTPVITTPSYQVGVTRALPPMAPQLATPSAMSSNRLNAAIELEVNRRLKERINAVALQRQAFAVSALRQQQLRMNPPSMPSQQQMAAFLLQKQAGLLKNAGIMPPSAAPTMGYRAMAREGQPLPGAPPTNIQGARTA